MEEAPAKEPKAQMPHRMRIAWLIWQECKRFAKLPWHEVQQLLLQVVNKWFDHRAPRLGASLAFYTLLSAAPLFIVVIYVAGLAYGPEAAAGRLYWEIQGLIGHDGALAIQTIIEGASKPRSGGLAATILGFVTLFFGATSVVAELRDALNLVWEVPVAPTPNGLQSVLSVLRERSFAFGLVLGTGFLLLVLLVVNAVLTAIGTYFQQILPIPTAFLQILNSLISFFAITGLFALLFRVLPDLHLRWRDVAVGAVLTSILFNVGKMVIGLYLGQTGVASTFGAAGSLVVVLIWVYYSAQIFFFGAEFTKAYSDRFGRPRVVAVPEEQQEAVKP